MIESKVKKGQRKKEKKKKNQGLIKKRRKTSWKRVIDNNKKYTKVFQDVMEESVSMWRKKTIHAMLLSKLKSILMLESWSYFTTSTIFFLFSLFCLAIMVLAHRSGISTPQSHLRNETISETCEVNSFNYKAIYENTSFSFRLVASC